MIEQLDIHASVRHALKIRNPVVALESTLIAHGLPWPDNLQTVRAMQQAIVAEGASPAVIGIYRGRVCIGLDDELLEYFARADGIAKASRRDIALLLALERDGATTAAGTMMCAAMAGIRVFATGGIGGVHRRVEETLDVSADITELGRTTVAVVCSGAKSILDLPKTMEVLETQGVPIIGYGTNTFPAFYTRDSGLGLDVRVDTPESAARIVRIHQDLHAGGVVVANPIPESASLDSVELEGWILQAEADADAQGITGKALTPFMLDRLSTLSGGRTLVANKSLLQSNACVAARIAVALSSSYESDRIC